MISSKASLGGQVPDRVGDTGALSKPIMRLSYGQVARLLTTVLHVDSQKAIALTGRLKHFQRSKFPGGTNVGPGPRAVYGVDRVFALVFAFRLLAMRFPPRDAAAAVETNRTALCRMIIASWLRREGGQAEDDAGPLLAGIRPDGLEDLRRGDFAGGPADAIEPVTQRQVWSWMRGVDALPAPGLVVLDVDAIVGETLTAIEDLGLASRIDIATGFEALRREIDGDDKIVERE